MPKLQIKNYGKLKDRCSLKEIFGAVDLIINSHNCKIYSSEIKLEPEKRC